jgi:hypothetical protein
MAFDKPGKPDPPGKKSDATPSRYRIVEEGRKYWSDRPTSRGKVAGIGFGRPGDFMDCVRRVEPHLGAGARGFCAERHHDATGFWPGHAPGEGGK